THYASTLDNLINMASRDCMAKKREKTQAQAAVAVVGVPPEGSKTGTPREAAVPDSPPMARVVGVYADEHSAASLTTVVLSTGATVVSGVHQRQGKSVLESVAHAAAKALERVDPSRTFELDEVLLSGNGTGEKMVTVTGHLRWDGEERAVAGSSPVQDDLYAAAAEALIRAFGG
ncbi:MAG TPA: hypothetical protein VM328_12815, partial [Fimbriimonadaceae bacterium]|nr:hypothetical protein [Fimbriimonadaceae bacterium]